MKFSQIVAIFILIFVGWILGVVGFAEINGENIISDGSDEVIIDAEIKDITYEKYENNSHSLTNDKGYNSYLGSIVYEYDYNGGSYTNQRAITFGRGSPDKAEQSAKELYNVGEQIEVYVNRDNPRESDINPSDKTVIPIYLIMFSIISFVLALRKIYHTKKPNH